MLVNEAAIIVFFIKLSNENRGCSLRRPGGAGIPPPLLLSSTLVFQMNSGVLPNDKKELSSNEAKTIMIGVP